jgi:hypothetical protein
MIIDPYQPCFGGMVECNNVMILKRSSRGWSIRGKASKFSITV